MADSITGKVVGVGTFDSGGAMDFGGPVVVLLVGADCARKAAPLFGSHVELQLGAAAAEGDALSAYERIAMWHEEQAIAAAVKADREACSYREQQRRQFHREAATEIRRMVIAPTPPPHEVYEHQLYILRQGLVRAEALIADLRRELREEADDA